MTPRNLKPHRTAFLLHIVLAPLILLSVLTVVGGVLGYLHVGSWVALVAGAVWILLIGLLWAHALASYRKADYQLHADRIIIRSGGLVSNLELEVQFPKVTHVKWVRPWLGYKLFGVGHVYVEVAGSAAGSIAFACITESDEIQAELRRLLEQEFSMRTDEILHEEGPCGIAIVLDIMLKGGWAIFGGLMLFGGEVIPILSALLEPGSLELTTAHLWWLLLGIPLVGLVMVLGVLHFLDLKRRIYRVYNGVIEYHEGFLTRCDAYMPVENLSDSEVTRGIVQRLVGAYNVVLSCQGAGQEVTFLHLLRGPELGAAVDSLIKEAAAKPTREAEPVATPNEDGESLVKRPPPLPKEPLPELIYRMHKGRSLLPLVPFVLVAIPFVILAPFIAVFLYWAVMHVIRVFRTTYRLRDTGVGENFDFMRVTQREFSMDKVTGVVFRESLLDRMFQTITIQFWSIGAGKEIAFRNVPKDEVLIKAIRERAGIEFSTHKDTIQPEHSLWHFLCANVLGLLFAATVTGGAAAAAVYVHWGYGLIAAPFVLLPPIGFLWGRIYYRRLQLMLFEEGVVFTRGIIVQQHTYARYDNIKDITTCKIPACNCGSIRFNVAGEQVLQQGAAIPYGFTVSYLGDLLGKNETFDYTVLGAPATPEIEVIEARKALGNTAVRTILISIILLPLVVLLPITLPIVLWRAHLVRYRIEPGRVLMRRGALFLTQTSITFSRIDHIKTSEGMLNKFFKNGNIQISTAGSTSAELVLRDLKGHDAFYQALREVHRGGDD